jgi:diacylglycerol kinase
MKLISSIQYALRGISIAIQEQPNMKIHMVAIVVIAVIGLYLDFKYVDWCIVTVTIGVVLGAELVNTSVEEIVNFINPEKRVEAGRIKDLSAGAVLIVSLAALVIGVLLIFSKLTLA